MTKDELMEEMDEQIKEMKEQIEEMQAMIDGQQWTIEAQRERIAQYCETIEKIEKYFVNYLDDKDRLIFDLYIKELLEN